MKGKSSAGTVGRKIKRKYPRIEFLKIRISKQHKELLAAIRADYDSKIISDADIVEFAVEQYGQGIGIYIQP